MSGPHPRTAIEKIVGMHCVGWMRDIPPRAGDFVMIRPRRVMSHDNTSAIIDKFRLIAGRNAITSDPQQLVLVKDHDIQNHSTENHAKYAKISVFAERCGIRYEAPGRGIAHQVMIEEGHIRPGTLVVGSDSHSNMYGALAALGTPIVRTDAARIWYREETWWIVPRQARVTLRGEMQPGVCGKDVILALCAEFADGEVLNCAIEFAGDGVAELSIDDRLSIANMTTEWGALAGFFPQDARLDRYLDELGLPTDHPAPESDPDAVFEVEIELNLSTVSSTVSGPNTVSVTQPASSIPVNSIPINKAYLMSCVNGRLCDFEAAAARFGNGRTVAEGVSFYIGAASSTIEHEAKRTGVWQTLIDAGAIPLPPGCGACIGLGAGTLESGETGISATNRNFEGRMGARDASCYLASPVVVAESAACGYIAGPPMPESMVRASIQTTRSTVATDEDVVDIVPGFPSSISGRSIILTASDINTDGIYGKEVTYRDGVGFAEQGQYALLNYDPSFQSLVQTGDVLIAGDRFGMGSSREQAATALMSCGIGALICRSVNSTYLRNAINNGLIVITCPDLVDSLMSSIRQESVKRTAVGPSITIDFRNSVARAENRSYRIASLPTSAQELILDARSSLQHSSAAMPDGATS